MIYSRTTFIACLLLMLASTVHAQFCSTQEGTLLCYNRVDAERNETIVDSVYISKVVRQGEEVIVEQQQKHNMGKESPIGDFMTTIDIVYDGKNLTTITLMDAQKGVYTEIAIKAALQECKEEEKAAKEKQLREKAKKMFKETGSIVLPLKADAQAGERIPDSEYSYKVSIAKSTLKLTEGKYEGFEEVQTQAGTFRCLKVSYRMAMKFAFMSESMYTTEWYAPGVGMVKSEERDSKGKLQASAVLQRIATR